MAIRGEFRSKARTVTNGGEIAHIERFGEIIGIIEEGLISLLVWKWSTDMIMGVITMEIGVILIIN